MSRAAVIVSLLVLSGGLALPLDHLADLLGGVLVVVLALLASLLAPAANLLVGFDHTLRGFTFTFVYTSLASGTLGRWRQISTEAASSCVLR